MSSLAHEVKKRVLLSSVVKKTAELKGSGVRFLAICPFHDEKTPSFQVRDDLGRYKCFGCGASGDIFAFIMQLRGLSFKEAVEELAHEANIPIKPNIYKEKIASGEKPVDILRANEVAHQYFLRQLRLKNAGLKARNYLLEDRKLTITMVEQASLGFGGDNNEEFISYLETNGINSELAIQTGLLKKSASSLVSCFQNRIIFPIRTLSGQVIGFGGRIFKKEDSRPKYVNSHGNEIYEKKKSFYGLYESRHAINKGHAPCLVEGYFDAMAMWAAGTPALALCGTALSKDHVQVLKGLSSKVLIAFDHDSAGLKALLASLSLLFMRGLESRALIMTKKDPGEYLKDEELSELIAIIKNSYDALCYAIDASSCGLHDDIRERVAKIDSLIPIFENIQRPLLRRQYVSYLAHKLHEDPSILWMEIENKRKRGRQDKKTELIKEMPKVSTLSHYERILAPILQDYPEFLERAQGLIGLISQPFLDAFAKDGSPSTLEGAINEACSNGLSISSKEGSAIIDGLYEKLEKAKRRAALKITRLNLQQAEKDKNFSSILKSLKEQSEVLASEKGKRKERIVEHNKKEQPLTSNENYKTTAPDHDMIFDDEEGWY